MSRHFCEFAPKLRSLCYYSNVIPLLNQERVSRIMIKNKLEKTKKLSNNRDKIVKITLITRGPFWIFYTSTLFQFPGLLQKIPIS